MTVVVYDVGNVCPRPDMVTVSVTSRLEGLVRRNIVIVSSTKFPNTPPPPSDLVLVVIGFVSEIYLICFCREEGL